MKRFVLSCLWLATALAMTAQNAAPAPAPPRPAVEHVVIIIVDGLRPDCALLADAPTLRSLARGGAYSFWARTTGVAITLPSSTSMLTGVRPEKHGIIWNRDQPPGLQTYPAVPTVLEMAARAGCVTAMVAGKSKFAALNKPGTVTHAFLPAGAAAHTVFPPGTSCSDERVAAEAVRIIEAYRPGLLVVHFPDVDAAGHAKGWGSPAQLAQIGKTDAQIARVLAALDRAGLRSSTVVLVSADHGGAGLTHGADDPRSRHIPWIVNGPGVRKSFDLAQVAGPQVNTEDTCATVCWLLGLPQQPYFDGKPVYAAFEIAK
jgi:predicted AlkP superfamily pyrophosphatase or phosphodiesterase